MTLARENIELAHTKALKARQDVSIADVPDAPDGVGGPRDDTSPHERLQKAVTLYYEAIRSYLVSTPEGQRYFSGQAPDSMGEQGYGVLRWWTREKEVSLEELPDKPDDVPSLKEKQFYGDAIEEFLRDNELLLRPIMIEERDGERVAQAKIMELQVGLKHLDEIYDQRVEETVEPNDGDSFMACEREEETVTRVELQDLDLLMNAARELDRAAAELDLLADAKESDMKPYMRDFDASNGEASANISDAEITGSPDM